VTTAPIAADIQSNRLAPTRAGRPAVTSPCSCVLPSGPGRGARADPRTPRRQIRSPHAPEAQAACRRSASPVRPAPRSRPRRRDPPASCVPSCSSRLLSIGDCLVRSVYRWCAAGDTATMGPQRSIAWAAGKHDLAPATGGRV
jgi:hypothetical protein